MYIKLELLPPNSVFQHSSIPIPRSLWSDPPFILSYESRPGGMHSKYCRNMITDMSCGAQHNLYFEWKVVKYFTGPDLIQAVYLHE